jgi:hypothetical protein
MLVRVHLLGIRSSALVRGPWPGCFSSRRCVCVVRQDALSRFPRSRTIRCQRGPFRLHRILHARSSEALMQTENTRRGSKSYATYDEIREELRNASDYAAAMIQHEQTAASAMQKDGDLAVLVEAERLFMRDFKAYLAAVRSARDYVESAKNKSGEENWYVRRLAKPGIGNLFNFFRLLINQSLHQYRPRLEPRSKKVQIVGEPDAVLIPGPSGLMPNKMRVVGVVDATYAFRLDGLERATGMAYAELALEHPGEGVIPLALRYVDELKQILKNAERNGRFDAIQP